MGCSVCLVQLSVLNFSKWVWCLSDKEAMDYPLFICKGRTADVGLGETVLFSGNMLTKMLKCHCEGYLHFSLGSICSTVNSRSFLKKLCIYLSSFPKTLAPGNGPRISDFIEKKVISSRWLLGGQPFLFLERIWLTRFLSLGMGSAESLPNLVDHKTLLFDCRGGEMLDGEMLFLVQSHL